MTKQTKRKGERSFFLIREKFFTEQGTPFYCSKIYLGQEEYEIKSSGVKLTNQPIQDEQGEIIFFLERGEVAIKSGSYPICRNKTGKFKYYSLENVEGRSNIEIHEGNYLKDTQGCPLPGIKFDKDKVYKDNSIIVLDSKKTINYIRDTIFGDHEHGEKIGDMKFLEGGINWLS